MSIKHRVVQLEIEQQSNTATLWAWQVRVRTGAILVGRWLTNEGFVHGTRKDAEAAATRALECLRDVVEASGSVVGIRGGAIP